MKASKGGASLARGTGVVNGDPRLVSRGAIDVTAYAEGFVDPENPEFYYRFGVRRNPRTLAGVAPNGNLLLVAVYGRRPEYSVGTSFIESVRIMKALGAEEDVNLDYGALGPALVNRRRTPPASAPSATL